MKTLHEVFAQSRSNIRKMKRCTPYLFNEWQSLQMAEQRFKDARKALVEARKRWNAL